jgi:hypothetical protein
MPVISSRLAIGRPKACVSPWWVPLPRKRITTLCPVGHHNLYGVIELGKGLTVGSGELLGPFNGTYDSAGRLIADVVGRR